MVVNAARFRKILNILVVKLHEVIDHVVAPVASIVKRQVSNVTLGTFPTRLGLLWLLLSVSRFLLLETQQFINLKAFSELFKTDVAFGAWEPEFLLFLTVGTLPVRLWVFLLGFPVFMLHLNLDKHFLKGNTAHIFEVLKLVVALFAVIWLVEQVVDLAIWTVPHRHELNFKSLWFLFLFRHFDFHRRRVNL
jgi:hypothetical protein